MFASYLGSQARMRLSFPLLSNLRRKGPYYVVLGNIRKHGRQVQFVIDDQVQTDSCRLCIFQENVERWFAISGFIFWFHSFACLPQQTKSSKPALTNVNGAITKLTRRLQRRRHIPEFRGCRVPNFQVHSTYCAFQTVHVELCTVRVEALIHACLVKIKHRPVA